MESFRWRHKKRGTYYREIGRGKLQWTTNTVMTSNIDDTPMVIYQAETDGSLWCRPVSEFEDGRFEKVGG